MAAYRQVELFGGALAAALPTTFADVSDIRQVPDNQEVYLDLEGFTSVVFDILERVEESDAEALQVHLKDITEGDGEAEEGMKTWNTSEANFLKLPEHTPAYTLLATSPPAEKQRGRANEPDFVGIIVCLVRLAKQKTDIVITVNVPHIVGQYSRDEMDLQAGQYGPLLEKGLAYQQKLLESFEIKDWELFAPE